MDSAMRRRAERDATLASSCGFLGEVTLTDSAVIILFAGLLGAGDTLAMLATSLLPLVNGLCIIPMALVAARVGSKRQILWSCSLAAVAYAAAICAPCGGFWASHILMLAILLFAVFLSGFLAGWFPLLDGFLDRDGRAAFFGRMRFCHQAAAAVFLALVGGMIGSDPTVGQLQLVLALGAAIFIGRILFIARIPVAPGEGGKRGPDRPLAAAVANRGLTGFSLYLFVLNTAAFGTVPLAFLHLTGRLGAPGNVVVLISAGSLFGMLAGYAVAPWLIRHGGSRSALLSSHIVLALVNLALASLGVGGGSVWCLVGGLLGLYGFAIAAASIVSSSEMMALARPDNKVMSMAFCGAFSYGGSGLARLLTSLVLGTGMLAPGWYLAGIEISRYQTMFLIYAALIIGAAAFLLIVPAVVPESDPQGR